MNNLFAKIRLMKKNIKYFIPLLCKANPFSIVFLFLNAVFDSLSTIIYILFPKLIIDELIGSKDKQKLILLVIIMTSSLLVINIIQIILQQISHYYIEKTNLLIDEMFNEKIASVDYFNIEDPKFNDELSYAKQCLDEYSNGIYSFTYTLETIIRCIITFFSTVGLFIYSSLPWFIIVLLTLIMFIYVIFVSSVNTKYIKLEEKFNKLFVRTRLKHWYYNKSILSFRFQMNLRAYNAKKLIDEYSNQTCTEINNGDKSLSKKLKRLNAFSSCIELLFSLVLPLLILIFASYKYSISIAVITMTIQTISTIQTSLGSFFYTVKSYYQDCVYQDNFINLMNKQSIFIDGVERIDRIESIEFKNVSFKYPRTDKYVLENISFKLDNKKKISLVGLNGAGKTTIIKLLCRFYEVVEGEILVNGVNIKNYLYEDYMKQLSVVFQDFKIISFSVKDNIAIIDEDKEKLDDVLRKTLVYDKIISLPNKENTFVNKWFDKTGVTFSGGEMQKFALARALYKDSDLVILDEPTSNLDPEAEAQIYYHFNDVVGNKLCLFISHRLSSCIFSDSIMVLDGSKLVEIGTHSSLMQNKDGLYYKMFTEQAKYYKN